MVTDVIGSNVHRFFIFRRNILQYFVNPPYVLPDFCFECVRKSRTENYSPKVVLKEVPLCSKGLVLMVIKIVSKWYKQAVIRKQLRDWNSEKGSKVIYCHFKSVYHIIPNVNEFVFIQLQYMLFVAFLHKAHRNGLQHSGFWDCLVTNALQLSNQFFIFFG